MMNMEVRRKYSWFQMIRSAFNTSKKEEVVRQIVEEGEEKNM